jgi:sulfide:quinone oxidoreductase
MRTQIVILGGGTGGTITANRLRKRFSEDAVDIHVVDRDDRHIYQPGLLFVPFGVVEPSSIVRARRRQFRNGIRFHEADVGFAETNRQRVTLSNGEKLSYDVLVVASGAQLLPEETDGLVGPGWGDRVHTFYDLDGATRLRDTLERFRGGRVVVDIADMPIKCPVAPIEFVFLLDAYLRERRLRASSEIVLATPLDGCFTRPIASKHLTHLLADKGIELEVEFTAGEVDGVGGVLTSYDGRTIDFDLLVAVPVHGGASYVGRSAGLGDALDYVPTDPHTLQTLAAENVFALGDATSLPSSKAGSVAHFEGELLDRNIARYLAGDELESRFDGHSNCFIETGGHKALLIDFNYDTEPVTGRFPTALGPLPLLRESRLNHAGKLLFQWIYWHALLPGHNLPLVGPEMPTAGKHLATKGA